MRSKRDRQRMVDLHQALVPATIRRLKLHAPYPLDQEDLVGAGLLGLVLAIDGFDPKYGAQFETYAIGKIRFALLDFIRNSVSGSRSESTGYRETPVSLDITNAFGTPLCDCIADTDPHRIPVQYAEYHEQRQTLAEAVAGLPLREMTVVKRHTIDGESLASVARDMGVSRTRAVQIHQHALNRLAQHIGNAANVL